MSTSAEQVARLLSLVPYLQANPGVEIARAASVFGITPQQLVKDLNVLWMCGLPGGLPGDLIEIDMDAVTGEGRVVLSNADFLSRPMRFTSDEAMSLTVALRTIAEISAGEELAAVRSALAKLEQVVGEAADRVAIRVDTGSERIRHAVREAIRSAQRLRLEYQGASRSQTSHPVVDPVRIDLIDGAGYLQAWSLERGAWRTYKLDRIVEVTPTGEPAQDHGPAPRPESGWFSGEDNLLTLTLAPEAAWVCEYFPVRSQRRSWIGDTEVIIAKFPVASSEWATALLLRLGSGVIAAEPPGAALEAVARARAGLELIDQVDRTFSG